MGAALEQHPRVQLCGSSVPGGETGSPLDKPEIKFSFLFLSHQ